MSAFGRRGGVGGPGGARRQFGNAVPMKGGGPAPRPQPEEPQGGEQFPPIDPEALPGEETPVAPLHQAPPQSDAMAILAGDEVIGFYRLDYAATIVAWKAVPASVGLRSIRCCGPARPPKYSSPVSTKPALR